MPGIEPSLFAKPNVPIEDRIATFRFRPTSKELGINIGYGLMGASSRTIEDGDQFLKVLPNPVPIKLATIWMYFVLALIVLSVVVFPPRDRKSLTLVCAVLVLAGIVIIPTMMAILSWINQLEGDAPFLVYEKSSDTIELPRLSKSFPKAQLETIVFLDRFVDGNRHWQVALLTSDGSEWTYFHLFNEAGSGTGKGTGIGFLQFKELYEQLAESLGVESRRLKFSQQESALLPDKLSEQSA